ncbi:dynamin family protein [Diplogelasinospora grovesii]|uniref:Dynamin family protein n=1 Tax=Diplogelasinospora grovesii TaxID=303347 RepID=A0AAN6MXK0_9PEZI|nr:dynamin family protein [Diplogelasinospora grovesii]
MTIAAFHTDALSKLCSKDQLELLDSIDRLRLQGINNYVSLPQIIVCGDQSSGKSSVLEAISGVSFPIKSNLCTRFPTELVLRRTLHVSATVSIVPHQSRKEEERELLSGFHERLDGFDGLSGVISSATGAMGISTHGKAFSKDLLRVEITGPDRPHLTIVDLPGLIHSETKYQTAADVELIQDVVQGYMKEPRSIILAVVSAKNDFANQVVLKLARYADSTGCRTLGVITKPDTLTPGSDSEALYVSLARNQEVDFRLGWHVLKNMDSETGPWDLAQRDAIEAEFLSQGAWSELPQSALGIDKLRPRLSKVLLGQIAAELPSLISEIEAKYAACHDQLEKLGEPRASLDEQRRYLFHISQSFQSLVKASVDATYNDKFFEDAKSDQGYKQRIRAVVQNLNRDFSKDISMRGHYREITEKKLIGGDFQFGEGFQFGGGFQFQYRGGKGASSGATPITRDEFIEHIQHLMERTRGRELPGTFNPMIIGDLFHEQSQPWEAIGRRHVEEVWGAARSFLCLVVDHIADKATSKALVQEIIEPELKAVLETLRAKTDELLKPHRSGHPITYNHYFTEALQTARGTKKPDYAQIIMDFFSRPSLETQYHCNKYLNLQQLVANLEAESTSEPDMERLAASEALDCMNAYYKVALKRFIDDMAIEVIEAKLVDVLGNILSPVSVYEMPSDLVSRIAGESEESRTQREQLTRQLDVLRKGLDTCKRFAGLRIGGKNISRALSCPE